jgi:fumarate reductase subunit D
MCMYSARIVPILTLILGVVVAPGLTNAQAIQGSRVCDLGSHYDAATQRCIKYTKPL